MLSIHKQLLVFILLANFAYSFSWSADTEEDPVALSGVRGGLVVVLNDEQLIAEMQIDDRYLVQGLFRDERSKESARRKLESRGIYGQVTVKMWQGDSLPYLDNMVNLVIAGDDASAPLDEVFRVLAPRGVLLSRKEIKGQDSTSVGGWHRAAKAWPDTIDEWTHWLHAPDNNAVSGDSGDQIPRGLQWVQPPRWWKSHELAPPFSAMVTANGRLFYIADESLPGIANMPDRWQIIARDAFNGIELWKKPIQDWGMKFWMPNGDVAGSPHRRTQSPSQVLRRLVAVGDRVFVTPGLFAPVAMLDAATGETLETFAGTENAFEILADGDRLYLATNSALKDKRSDPAISIMAVNVGSGELLWETKGFKGVWQTESMSSQYVDAHLTLGKEGLFFVDQQNIVALDPDTGVAKWTTERMDAGSSRSNRGTDQGVFSRCVLVYHDSVLLHCYGGRGFGASLLAFDADSGKKLWAKGANSMAYRASPDLFVNRGLVWMLNGDDWSYEGLDPLTGEKERSIDMSLISSGTHHNCFRNKATQDFFLYGRNKGVEFFPVDGSDSKRINWAKGACRYGIMPANGMIYFPSHFCTCYATAKLNGMLALAHTGIAVTEPSTSDQVIKGPAFDNELSNDTGEADWPAYRQNIARTGFQPVPLPDEMKIKWTARIGGDLTPPIVADQMVFVAQKDDHRVVCLDAGHGDVKWTFPTDGRVDSSPTFYKGRLIFGGNDGFVYCLDAESGELAWRFRAAPADKQMVAFDQVDSVWPVFGALLVHDDKVYCTAGRNANVNSGIYLYKLDVRTGRPLAAVRHVADITEQGEVDSGVNADILVGDGTRMHLRGMMFDMQSLDVIDKGQGSLRVGIKDLDLTIALGGFLDDSFFNGTFWSYRGIVASMLGLDTEHVYGVNIYSTTKFKSSQHVNFHPSSQEVRLFAVNNGVSGKSKRALWTSILPLKATSLLVGSDSLYLAGVRDKVDTEDPWAYFDGRKGGLIAIYSKEDGKLSGQIELESPPVFDGMASAAKTLVISCQDGAVLCFE